MYYIGKAVDAAIDCLKAIFSITVRSSSNESLMDDDFLTALFTALPSGLEDNVDLTHMCHSISILLHYPRGNLLRFVKEVPCPPGHTLIQKYPRIPWKRLAMLLNSLEIQMLRNDYDPSMSDTIPMVELILRTLAAKDVSIRKCLRKQILPSKL